MTITGQNLIANLPSTESTDTFSATNPATGETLTPEFHESTAAEIDRALPGIRTG